MQSAEQLTMSDTIPWKDLLESLAPAFEYTGQRLGRVLWWRKYRRIREYAAHLVASGAVSTEAWSLAQPADGGKLLVIDSQRRIVFLLHGKHRKACLPSEVLEYEIRIDQRKVELVIVVQDPNHPVYEFGGNGTKAITDFRHGRGLLVYLKSIQKLASDSDEQLIHRGDEI
jgi:hypothetical protein